MRHPTIAKQVRMWRRARGLSQRGLGAAAGIAPAMVHKLESGSIGDPRLSTCRKLAEALGVVLVDLLEKSPTKRAKGRGPSRTCS
jgi:transcriptional regulator with XRE-family HTH domain